MKKKTKTMLPKRRNRSSERKKEKTFASVQEMKRFLFPDGDSPGRGLPGEQRGTEIADRVFREIAAQIER